MPEGYLKIKEGLMKEGKSEKDAEEHAARIWNSKHPDNPVGGNKKHEEPKTMIGGFDDSSFKILEND